MSNNSSPAQPGSSQVHCHSATNGVAHANGVDPKPNTEILDSGFYRADLVRLVTQCLHSLGYSHSAETLEKESQILLLSPAVAEFRQGILDGTWDQVNSCIPELKLDDEELVANIKFFVFQQKYLELLEERKVSEALQCLRLELTPLKHSPERVHKLSSLLMCKTVEDLKEKAQWDGSAGNSRKDLLKQLQEFIPPSMLVPENRLETLLQQAIKQQMNGCLYHNSKQKSWGLFEDHTCTRDEIPSETRVVLEKHSDEVWYVQFSHNGRWLASASKDNMVVIWDVVQPETQNAHFLTGHTQPLSFLAWSPDDEMMLTCGNDNLVKLWRVATGDCVCTFSKHTEAVTACAWLPDGKHFVSGGLDKNIFVWDIEGNAVQSWHGPRVNDLAVSHMGDCMITICADKKIRVYKLSKNDKTGLPEVITSNEQHIPETESITSLCLSGDSRYLLVNIASDTPEIHVWDLEERSLVHKYRGQKQGRFVIRSSFGGTNEGFIVSGSEDSQVYIWHRYNATLLQVLPGHSGTVNAVAWNPTDPYMFASASDDHTVRLWGIPTKHKSQRRLHQ